jgi:hypothetical protein
MKITQIFTKPKKTKKLSEDKFHSEKMSDQELDLNKGRRLK